MVSSKTSTDNERISKKQARSKSSLIIKDDSNIGDFLASSILTAKELARLTVGANMSQSDVIWPFELRKPLVKPDIERNLTTQMCRLHQWYLEQFRQGIQAFPIRYRDEYFLNGDDYFWVKFKCFYKMYKKDTLGVVIIRVWTL